MNPIIYFAFIIILFTLSCNNSKKIIENSKIKSCTNQFVEVKFYCNDSCLNSSLSSIFRISKNHLIRMPYIGDFDLSQKNEVQIAEEIKSRSMQLLEVSPNVSVSFIACERSTSIGSR